MKRLEIDSLSDLKYVAQEVVESLDGRTVVLLRGEMGAGKTTLISRIAAYLGAEDVVTSPTFALVNQYEGRECRIFHFDFYRIEEIEEVFDLGYEEYFYSGDLCFVEWPEKIEPLLPDDAMTVRITVGDDEHRIFEIE
ncbi:MAG: tRNA (adenosine(37)-N6)-threonylcarbamoyltransferase complex ATPase subunit type 1 TsaE [Alistipes sp.]|nr:tRNA (adenosine(37)-N6)-threonylcarbamoyltransferase complex ATPase subunit type 1 TsaE [Alistipes sp.]MBQ3197230.1 tRNA (adenosine(37)-N6)-threonylcarbamoyltransferase complex ATPase subunit type 1 TsaE [Alistipes sp.]MBQ4532176.1 tRNA (adenosine(37)-N6)-threonylcarbamoyltransferase complex ATPase subunit type 1 TsaE [Alistipes sp.]MBQ6989272.1 tRNA (adenosine(37)-N6)-threonylcarbamoyltransferase complex ATPase subunit type 1 TsaE [Alistipes sp.]MBR2006779.1 tRNA (adenosine(37)-N6)-threonyl